MLDEMGDLHQTIRWAFVARVTRERYLPQRKPDQFKHLAALIEGIAVFGLIELLKEIELHLKRNIVRVLSCDMDWWEHLPESVKRAAAMRHRWAVTQIGRRHAGRAQRIEWLSFGDVIKTLRSLSELQWRAVLHAEVVRRETFTQNLATLKMFRDHEFAHPKPRRISNAALDKAFRAIYQIPQAICPDEWATANATLAHARAREPAERRALFTASHPSFRASDAELRAWVKCPILEPPDQCKHSPQVPLPIQRWRFRLLTFCAEQESTGELLFGCE